MRNRMAGLKFSRRPICAARATWNCDCRLGRRGDRISGLFAAAQESAYGPKREAGCVFFPKSAPWLDEPKAELLGFPNVKNDDQVDSVTQALNWIARHHQNQVSWVAPIIVTKPRRYPGDPPDNWWLER